MWIARPEKKDNISGDAVVTAHAQVLLTGETQMLLKCIDQFAQTRASARGFWRLRRED